jgi:hypothetical protein
MSYVLENIKALSGLEAIRKRPKFYFNLEDSLLPTKMVAWLSANVLRGSSSYIKFNKDVIYVGWSEPMSTDLRYPKIKDSYKTIAEAHLSEVLVGSDDFYGNDIDIDMQLSWLVAVCSRFEVVISDEEVLSQTYVAGIPTTPLEKVSKSADRGTHFCFNFDSGLLPTTEIDYEFLTSWAATQNNISIL